MDPDIHVLKNGTSMSFERILNKYLRLNSKKATKEFVIWPLMRFEGILEDLVCLYEEKEGVDSETIHSLEQMLLLELTDQYWKDHLLADRLRMVLVCEVMATKSTLEYKREGTDMFMMMSSLRDEAVVTRVLRMSEEQILQIQQNNQIQQGGQSRYLAKKITQTTDPSKILGSERPVGFTAPSSDELQQMAQQRQLERGTTANDAKARQKAKKKCVWNRHNCRKWKKIVLRKDWKPKSMV